MLEERGQGHSHWGERVAGGPWPLTSVFKPRKVHKFQFRTSGILLFTDVQKLYGPENSQHLLCMLQFLDNLWRLFIFLTTLGKYHTSRSTFWKPLIIGRILDLSKKSSKTWEVSIWSGPRLNIIAWKLELLEIFSEVIVASKCGPLAGVEKEAMS